MRRVCSARPAGHAHSLLPFLGGFGPFAACFLIGLHKINVAHAKGGREFEQRDHRGIAPATLQIAYVLLSKAGCFRKFLLREALLLPQSPKVSANQLAHIHLRKLLLYTL